MPAFYYVLEKLCNCSQPSTNPSVTFYFQVHIKSIENKYNILLNKVKNLATLFYKKLKLNYLKKQYYLDYSADLAGSQDCQQQSFAISRTCWFSVQ